VNIDSRARKRELVNTMDMILQQALTEALRYGYLTLRLSAARHFGQDGSNTSDSAAVSAEGRSTSKQCRT
jgi:hypothetical protein